MSTAQKAAISDAESLRGRHAWLLGALVLLIFESSTRLVMPVGRFGYSAFFSAVLIAGIRSAGARGPVLWGAIALGIPALAVQWASYYSDSTLLIILNLGSVGAFLLYAGVAILRQIVRSAIVTLDTVLGGVVVYLLIGLQFLVLYSLTEFLQPGSFAGVEAIEVVGGQGIPDLLYFSFVTLTTLGYGDIRPVGEIARTLAFMQAVIGQLYLTVLIAWLVGVHISQNRERS